MSWMLATGAKARKDAAIRGADRDPDAKGGYRRSGSDGESPFATTQQCRYCGKEYRNNTGEWCSAFCSWECQRKKKAEQICEVCGQAGHSQETAYGKQKTVIFCPKEKTWAEVWKEADGKEVAIPF